MKYKEIVKYKEWGYNFENIIVTVKTVLKIWNFIIQRSVVFFSGHTTNNGSDTSRGRIHIIQVQLLWRGGLFVSCLCKNT